MPSEARLQGVVPIIPTPFTADEEIDFEALARCVQFAADSGLCAVCLPAYASEFYKLSEAERRRVIETAICAADGKIAVMAQANHPAARLAAGLAREYESLGAGLISFALPRVFPLKESDLIDYAATVCRATRLPVLIQDFNPGGPTVGGEFAVTLAERCPNFRYLKLEEPLMGGKVRSIVEAASGRVEVLEGWGGMYLLDLIPAGICGLMPGLGIADLLSHVWQAARAGRDEEATEIFQVLLPQIVFSLQHSELFNWVEKRLLLARGVLPQSSTHVRRATWTPDEATLRHGDRLNAAVVALAARLASKLRG
ncbi:MAG TPA: dihydrodipicolinate synthase family protein [Pirellulales bacterium]|nr:dihydrodipicolinate synthase family protein [Pirellulales bacterium]